MMGILIDADKLLSLIKEQKVKETGAYTRGLNAGLNIAKSIIGDEARIPTAYDVEAVAERLEKEIEWYETHGCNNDLNRGIIGATRKAIEIVRGGGRFNG